MTLRDVLSGVPLRTPLAPELAAAHVAGLDYDSRRVQPGFLFFAFPGARTDGRGFAQAAVERGALGTVSESPRPAGWTEPWIEVEHGRQALATAARTFYRQPDAAIAVTGVTGTNGKTTTTFVIDDLLRGAGRTTALIGTIEYRLGDRVLPAVNTTPESLDILRLLDQLRAQGGTHASMEISSHALALGRVHGLHVHTAIFTNFTRDHLDFHGTMENYFAAKASLFLPAGAPPPRSALINADDPYGPRIQTGASTTAIFYGLGDKARLRATQIESSFQGLRFTVEWEGGRHTVTSPLVGKINVYNLLAAFGAGLCQGLPPAQITALLARFRAVPGRFERIEQGQPFLVLVDYAHTDDALRNAIAAARELGPKRVITVFGCGGDRDRAKRPLMGMAAAEASDFVVLTSDNPRSEDPLQIMMDALVGLRRYDTPHLMEPDRALAIRKAIEMAAPGDVVLLAGKGHETYQVLKDQTIAFDDRDIARQVLHTSGYKGGA